MTHDEILKELCWVKPGQEKAKEELTAVFQWLKGCYGGDRGRRFSVVHNNGRRGSSQNFQEGRFQLEYKNSRKIVIHVWCRGLSEMISIDLFQSKLFSELPFF